MFQKKHLAPNAIIQNNGQRVIYFNYFRFYECFRLAYQFFIARIPNK